MPAAVAAIVSIAAAAPPGAATPAPPGAGKLSNERTFTRWASAAVPARAYARPSAQARRVGACAC